MALHIIISLSYIKLFVTFVIIIIIIIPCVEMGKSFHYLGCHFDFNMSSSQHVSKLSSLVQDLLCDIDEKSLHPKNKLMLYSHYQYVLNLNSPGSSL